MSLQLKYPSSEPHLGAEEVPVDSSFERKEKGISADVAANAVYVKQPRGSGSHALFVFLLVLFLKLQKC